MNEGQRKFFDFILERIQDGKKEEAEGLLNENFKKQEEGSFGAMDAMQFGAKIISLLKPEFVDEVKDIIKNYVK